MSQSIDGRNDGLAASFFYQKEMYRGDFPGASPWIGRTMDWRSPLWLEESLLALTKWPG